MRFDPGRGCFADLVLTRGDGGERVDRTEIEPGQTVIQDRGYARVRDFAAVLAAQADFITRIGWNALRFTDAHGHRVDPLALLSSDVAAVEYSVHVKGLTPAVRLVIKPIPPEIIAGQHRRVARRASKGGHVLDPRTLRAAGYMMLVTSLPADRHSPEQVMEMYRNRWRIELGFRRLKALGGVDGLPARTWLLAAVLTDEIASEIAGFHP